VSRTRKPRHAVVSKAVSDKAGFDVDAWYAADNNLHSRAHLREA
jgi:hypothetical protein